MRRRTGGLLISALAVVLPAASVEATPTVTFRVTAVPIPGFVHTGNRPGLGAELKVEYTIAGTEYGGFPPPLRNLDLGLPSGVTLHPNGFTTCVYPVLQPVGPGPYGCPEGSLAGRVMQASKYVAFGTEVVPETTTVETHYAPSGGLTLFEFGRSPVLVESLSEARFVEGDDGARHLEAEFPLVETEPGAQDASTSSFGFAFGSAIREAAKVRYYLRMPTSCPMGYFPFTSRLSFASIGGLRAATVASEYRAPCPRLPQESAQEALPGTGGVVTAPASGVCASRRDFRIHIVHIPHLIYRLVTVEVNGKPVKVLSGQRTSAQIDLRGMPKGRYVARIGVVTSTGRLITGTRTYHTCAAHPKHPKRTPRL